MKKKQVCKTCGSDDVVKDGWASWDEEKQEWILEIIFDDNDYCKTCDGQTKIVDKPIE